MSWGYHQARAAQAAFDALDAAEISWMILRNHQGLPRNNRSKDIDLALSKSEFDHAEKVISRKIKSAGFDRVNIEHFQYVRCLTYFGFFPDGPASIKIDLLDGFSFRGAALFDFQRISKRAKIDGDFIVPHPVDDAVMLWLKPLLNGGIIKENYRADILQAIQASPAEYGAELGRLFSPYWARRLIAMLRGGELAETAKLKRWLRYCAWWKCFRHSPWQTLAGAIQHFTAEIRRRSKKSPGTFIAIAGPDGVGKSTLIDGLADTLAVLQVKDRKNISVQHFRPHILPNISALLTGEQEEIGAIHDPHTKPPASKLQSTMKLAYYVLDFTVGYYWKIRPLLARGNTVIFDRYAFEFLVDARRSRMTLSPIIAKFAWLLIPKPQLLIVLDADPKTVHSRKPELPISVIKDLNARYLKFAATERSAHIIDANQTSSKVLSSTINHILTSSYQTID